MALVRASVANVYWGLGCLIFIVVVFCFTLVPCPSLLISRSGGLNTVWIDIEHHSSFLFGFLVSGKTK